MGIIATWAATKGLESAGRALQEILSNQDIDQRISTELAVISEKLDLLIGAPYRESQLYLLEGNIEKAKERVIAAIALNEFDLPAKLLYCLLLARTNKAHRSLDYFEEILRDFGPHRSLIPENIIDILCKCVCEYRLLNGIKPFFVGVSNSNKEEYLLREAAQSYRPVAVHCSLSAIVVRWEIKEGCTWIGSTHFGMHFLPRLCIYNWSGKNILNEQISDSRSWKILAFTEKYVVILKESRYLGRESIVIYKATDGTIVNLPFHPSRDRISRLFSSEELYWISMEGAWPEPKIDLHFCGARVQSQPDRSLAIFPE